MLITGQKKTPISVSMNGQSVSLIEYYIVDSWRSWKPPGM